MTKGQTAGDRLTNIEERREAAKAALLRAEARVADLAYAVTGGRADKAEELAEATADMEGIRSDITVLNAAAATARREVEAEKDRRIAERRAHEWGEAERALERLQEAASSFEAAADAARMAHYQMGAALADLRRHTGEAIDRQSPRRQPLLQLGLLNTSTVASVVEAEVAWIGGGARPPEARIAAKISDHVARFKAMAERAMTPPEPVVEPLPEPEPAPYEERMAEKRRLDAMEAAEQQRRGTEGLPPGYFRDPAGLVRRSPNGVVVPAEELKRMQEFAHA